MAEDSYKPMMPKREIKRRIAHQNRVYEEGRRRKKQEIYNLNNSSFRKCLWNSLPIPLTNAVLREVKEKDRVLDVGTGSGINAILAASKSKAFFRWNSLRIAVPVASKRDGPSTDIFVDLELPNWKMINVEVDTGSDILVLNENIMEELGIIKSPIRWRKSREGTKPETALQDIFQISLAQ